MESASPARDEFWLVAIEVARRWLAGSPPPKGAVYALDAVYAVRDELRVQAEADARGAERIFDRGLAAADGLRGCGAGVPKEGGKT